MLLWPQLLTPIIDPEFREDTIFLYSKGWDFLESYFYIQISYPY